jgi:hypothetical protein
MSCLQGGKSTKLIGKNNLSTPMTFTLTGTAQKVYLKLLMLKTAISNMFQPLMSSLQPSYMFLHASTITVLMAKKAEHFNGQFTSI